MRPDVRYDDGLNMVVAIKVEQVVPEIFKRHGD